MPTPKERLSHLLELAAKGPEQRAELAGEVADLLLDWPPQYPGAMRVTFEALLEKIAREMDFAARSALAARFEGRSDAPLTLLNEFFLAAPATMRDAILARNDEGTGAVFASIDHEALLSSARSRGDFTAALVRHVGIPAETAVEILKDESGRALAIVCKGAGVNRATFSALAVLAGPVRRAGENFALLSIYDRVPANGAARLLAVWRGKLETASDNREAAA
jgi:hypothetical protein